MTLRLQPWHPEPAWAITIAGGLLLLAGGLAALGVVLAQGPQAALVFGAFALPPLAAGIGLLQHRVWAWDLGLAIVLSGIAVVAIRLDAEGTRSALVGPLLTDIFVAALLIWARPRRRREAEELG